MDDVLLKKWEAQSKDEATIRRQARDQPSYWTSDPASLISASSIHSLILGSGDGIFASILPAIEAAEHEVIIVTCFWARSSSLERLNASLRRLSAKATQNGCRTRVRICFSSLSLFQKLFHTRSLEGYVYPQYDWKTKLGLPEPIELQGLDLEVKSIFVTPFSVMHPKFILIDRRRIFLPSCNVSWETWFEGCIELTGPICSQFHRFWQSFWASSWDKHASIPAPGLKTTAPISYTQAVLAALRTSLLDVVSVFLPSPHHALSVLESFTRPTDPPTPLNLLITSIFANAQQSIYIQTPNLTSKVVLTNIVSALDRGVNIRIVTSRRLMILEQLVTARTTTARCVRWLIRQHKRLIQAGLRARTSSNSADADLERALVKDIGRLEVGFYEPRPEAGEAEPVQSHLKLTIVDEEMVVLGSGNLDRASWVTSQELGVAFINKDFASLVTGALKKSLDGRVTMAYPDT